MRCARQRWRAERGKQVSIALMTPGAPSETTSSGSPRPRARMSWKKARHRFGVLLRSRHQVQQHPAARHRVAPGRHHRLTALAGTDALGDAVDEQVDDLVLAQVAGGEVLVVGPELLAELARPRSATAAAGRSRP